MFWFSRKRKAVGTLLDSMTGRIKGKYSEHEINTLKIIYKPHACRSDRNAQVKKIADRLNRSKGSVTAKLVQLRLYTPCIKIMN